MSLSVPFGGVGGGGQLKIDRVTITPDNMEYTVHVWLGKETRVSVFRTWRLS